MSARCMALDLSLVVEKRDAIAIAIVKGQLVSVREPGKENRSRSPSTPRILGVTLEFSLWNVVISELLRVYQRAVILVVG